MRRIRGAAALGAACILLLAGAAAIAQPTALPTQAAPENERVRILQTELAREREAVAEAARRRAERLAVGDQRGAQEAVLQGTRAAENIAALRREIELASRSLSAKPAPRDSSTPEPASPWWDVYATTRRPPTGAAMPPIRPNP